MVPSPPSPSETSSRAEYRRDYYERQAKIGKWALDAGIFKVRRTHWKHQVPDVTPPSIKTCSQRTPLQESYLDKLPMDCFRGVVLLLDMQSVFRLRQTNLNSRQMVSSLFEYRCATTYALGLFQAGLEHRTARYITLARFHRQLCNTKCRRCKTKYIAFFVDLLSWDRYCVRHVEEEVLYRPYLKKSYVSYLPWMTEEILSRIPVFRVQDDQVVSQDRALRIGKKVSPETYGSDYNKLDKVSSVLFTRMFIQTPYLGTKNNGVRTLSSFALVLKFRCQTKAWLRRIKRNQECDSLFEEWGHRENWELFHLFGRLELDPYHDNE